MITRAIIDSVLDPYTFKISIPILNRTSSSTVKTSKALLPEAVICCSPGYSMNLQSGDVVIVAGDDTEKDWTILGLLFTSSMREGTADLVLNDLKVVNAVTLPTNTSIGNVSNSNIQCLSGAKENIQKQLDEIVRRLDELTTSKSEENIQN